MISKLNNKDRNAVKSLSQNKINIIYAKFERSNLKKKNCPKFTFQITYYSK